jgi:hypothetical protein
MLIGIGFATAVVVGTLVAREIARRGEPREPALPWVITDIARMQGTLMSGMASVSITCLVLILSFTSRGAGADGSVGLDTVAIMFGGAFGFFLQTFHALSFIPDRALVGERIFRFYYGLTVNLQFRTAALLIFGQSTLVEFYGLTTAVDVITMITPGGIAAVFIVVAMVGDHLGLVRFGASMLTAMVGVVLAALFIALTLQTGTQEADGALTMTVLFMVINAASFAAIGVALLTPGRPRLRAFADRHARLFATIDVQLTVLSIVFLWMTVVRIV